MSQFDVRCPSCNVSMKSKGNILICPQCGSTTTADRKRKIEEQQGLSPFVKALVALFIVGALIGFGFWVTFSTRTRVQVDFQQEPMITVDGFEIEVSATARTYYQGVVDDVASRTMTFVLRQSIQQCAGTMRHEEIVRNHADLVQCANSVAEDSLARIGFRLNSLVISDISWEPASIQSVLSDPNN